MIKFSCLQEYICIYEYDIVLDSFPIHLCKTYVFIHND